MANTNLDYSSADVDIKINSGDNDSLDIVNTQNGTPINITGYTFTLFIEQSDGTILVQKDYTIVSAVDGTATIKLTSTEWALITENCARYYVLQTLSGDESTLFGGRFNVLARGK